MDSETDCYTLAIRGQRKAKSCSFASKHSGKKSKKKARGGEGGKNEVGKKRIQGRFVVRNPGFEDSVDLSARLGKSWVFCFPADKDEGNKV